MIKVDFRRMKHPVLRGGARESGKPSMGPELVPGDAVFSIVAYVVVSMVAYVVFSIVAYAAFNSSTLELLPIRS